MADVHTTAIRSFNMSQIKSKDTKPEMIVRKALFANGFRFRLHDKNLSGKLKIRNLTNCSEYIIKLIELI